MTGGRGRKTGALAIPTLVLLLIGCGAPTGPHVADVFFDDPHSFASPELVTVEHLALDLAVDFETKTIQGVASLDLDNRGGVSELVLDSWGLEVRGVSLDEERRETTFELGEEVEFLGRPLKVAIEPDTRVVHVEYETAPDAIALQWLEPRQTAGGRHPFLYTQSESVFARSWVPCQDSPSVRVTYEATVSVPPGLMALMSAENPVRTTPDGVYAFEMKQPIPTYLLALAVGDVAFRSLGPRTGVYAEPSVLDRAAYEFGETERMLETAESLFGAYRWGRYDMLVLPPSFPVGGMENPRLTFVTPTLLAGDRSLVSTIAHEISHSWSGNLVAAATWNDLWLNEGLTNYLERRVMEQVHDAGYVDMLALLDGALLESELARLGDDPLSHLRLELDGRDPEESFGDVTYEKGYLFFRMLEEALGREEWDAALREYFDTFAFGAVDTDRFLAFLRERVLAGRGDAVEAETSLHLDEWVDGPALPDNRPEIRSDDLDAVERQLAAWVDGLPAEQLDTASWTTHHTVHFIRSLPADLDPSRMAELDGVFRWNDAGNAIVRQAWLMRAIARGYAPAEASCKEFLKSVGRHWLILPLYEELAATPGGMALARGIYDEAREGYHGVVRREIDGLLGFESGE